MRYIRKLYDHREPPGMEWKILRRVPGLLLGALMVPLLMSIGGRLLSRRREVPGTVHR